MRDYLSITRFDSHYFRKQVYYRHGDDKYGGTKVQGSLPGTGSTAFPVLLRGRAEATTGPQPYPTDYYGFRFESVPRLAIHEWRTDWKKYIDGWYYALESAGELSPLSWNSLLSSPFTYFSEDGKDGFKPNVSAETRGRAIKSANSKLRSDSINIGQTVGEMPEALREASKLVKGVIQTILALRKGNLPRAQYHLGTVLGRRKAAEAAQGASNAYLFYRFGVAPVLNDINNMMSEIGKAMSQPDFMKVKGTATATRSLPSWSGYSFSGELLEVCEIGYSVRPKPLYAAAFLGLTNPLATVWELVPLSFVVNWFVSIGDVLNALDAGVGLEYVSGYQTTVVKGSYTAAYKTSWSSPGGYDINAFAMERKKILYAPATPPLHLKLGGLSTGKLVTGAALLMSFVETGNLGALNPKKR